MENKDQRYFLDDSNMIYIKPGPNVAPFPVATVSDTEIEVTVARALKAFSAELQRKSKGRQTQVKYAREGMAELVEVLEGGGSKYFVLDDSLNVAEDFKRLQELAQGLKGWLRDAVDLEPIDGVFTKRDKPPDKGGKGDESNLG